MKSRRPRGQRKQEKWIEAVAQQHNVCLECVAPIAGDKQTNKKKEQCLSQRFCSTSYKELSFSAGIWAYTALWLLVPQALPASLPPENSENPPMNTETTQLQII